MENFLGLLKRFIDFPDLRFDIENGITICDRCDNKLVKRREEEWESYFYFNLETRKNGIKVV